MLTSGFVNEAIAMAGEGASNKDIYTYLFVPKDSFNSWFANGRELVNQEYGRMSEDELNNLIQDGSFDAFDFLCLILYKGIMSKRWLAKKEMHKLVVNAANPQLAFKYLEAVYSADFDPKYRDNMDDTEEIEDESATSFVMSQFLQESQHHADAENKTAETDGSSSNETVLDTQES